MGDASKVEVAVCFVNLFAGDSDIVQSLSSGGVTKHLLEKEELPGDVLRREWVDILFPRPRSLAMPFSMVSTEAL